MIEIQYKILSPILGAIQSLVLTIVGVFLFLNCLQNIDTFDVKRILGLVIGFVCALLFGFFLYLNCKQIINRKYAFAFSPNGIWLPNLGTKEFTPWSNIKKISIQNRSLTNFSKSISWFFPKAYMMEIHLRKPLNNNTFMGTRDSWFIELKSLKLLSVDSLYNDLKTYCPIEKGN